MQISRNFQLSYLVCDQCNISNFLLVLSISRFLFNCRYRGQTPLKSRGDTENPRLAEIFVYKSERYVATVCMLRTVLASREKALRDFREENTKKKRKQERRKRFRRKESRPHRRVQDVLIVQSIPLYPF